MSNLSSERRAWLVKNVLPNEPALRTWLARRKVAGLDVDDVVQETYATLAELESVAHIVNPRTYAFSIAHSIILQHVRHRRVVSLASLAEWERLRVGTDEDLSAERRVSDHEELQLIAERIGSLPEKCRQAFSLRKVDGLTQKEVAQRMGVSEGTVEKHIGKALRILAATVGRERETIGAAPVPTVSSSQVRRWWRRDEK
ncbi:RNA polymerase sigma factor [Steroidobacter sp.]|uniref:RNA polymerase sigma factor n=1 Tax=Steroidobacter sp. TaxID=1978227 RepID=UPI001A5000E3|nr:sigma-70 family RNA polymerase sigma factor [Steroidobacter sp.]MBL8267506.1 sigma-70 family RNA polymerase sigma factor [Steroidobacter sp.]